jgi:FkbM family methyltransferase
MPDNATVLRPSVPKHDDLIIDVGMHTGEDTAFYLAKGFRVVAVEANPVLVSAARTRFAREIASGRLRIMDVAIANEAGVETLAVADGEFSIWSSLSSDYISRNAGIGVEYTQIQVPGVRFESILAECGIPHYLKIDIEGLDMLCVKALHQFSQRPSYVSLESNVSAPGAPAEAVISELAELWTLGYRRFKYVNQRRPEAQTGPNPPLEGAYVDAPFDPDGSGPFGRETPGPWLGLPAALAHAQLLRLAHNVGGYGGQWEYSLPGRAYRRLRAQFKRSPPGWYDIHARLGGVPD